jgi:arginine decarboxylase
MFLDQDSTPIIDALLTQGDRLHAPFYTPGHKRGVGMSEVLKRSWGDRVFRYDLPELPDLDNLHAPTGIIQTAQALAADTFGAEQTWFLVNGSTAGVMAAILATCREGDKIILPRNVHQSSIAGVIQTGAMPIFIHPEYDRGLDLAHSITPEAVKTVLEQHPDSKAVLMVSPTYYGVAGDISTIATIVHSYGIPLLVDEAHGAHFGFHPDLPPRALSQGADLAVQSTHKLLGAMTQAAMLHVRGKYLDRGRVSQALRLVQSTSPSYLLLASLDAARHQMAIQGRELMSQTLDLARMARDRISQIEGLSIVGEDLATTPGFRYLDPTRLTVTMTNLHLTGFAADEILHAQLGVTAELPSLRHLTFIISLGNTRGDIDHLVAGLTTLAQQHRGREIVPFASVGLPDLDLNQTAITPRQAYFSTSKTVSREEAIGEISAELICPYPPGIPVLIPGEIITPSAIDYLQSILSAGGEITGCRDRDLTTIDIVTNPITR